MNAQSWFGMFSLMCPGPRAEAWMYFHLQRVKNSVSKFSPRQRAL